MVTYFAKCRDVSQLLYSLLAAGCNNEMDTAYINGGRLERAKCSSAHGGAEAL